MCLDSLVLEFKSKMKEFDNDNPCLIFVDLWGESPSNAVAILLAENYDIQAVAGVNLPMLLEVLGGRSISQLICWLNRRRWLEQKAS